MPGGVAHKLPADLLKALIANPTALDAWKDITPLARNEFICWVEDAKQEMTRERRIRRTQEELEEGRRRPCCWQAPRAHRQVAVGASASILFIRRLGQPLLPRTGPVRAGVGRLTIANTAGPAKPSPDRNSRGNKRIITPRITL